MSLLFSALRIKSVTLKNRIVVSPMCQYSSTDGFASDWHLVHLGTRAIGGAGLVMTEAAAVSPVGRISPSDLGIWDDRHIEKLKQITDFIKEHNSVPGIQLAHAGRKASTTPPWKGGTQVDMHAGGWQTIAPSAISYKEGERLPHAMTLPEIDALVSDFGNAARRSMSAGFEVFEIHAAHGYLIHQFMSPLSNLRDDEYGGTFENRVRLLLRIVGELRLVIGDAKPLFVRISATDYAEGGWDIEQSVRLSKLLKDEGVDLMDVSSGALVSGVRIPIAPGYQVPFAERIKAEAGIPTGAVGLITEAQQAEDILASEKADLVFMARELLRNPYFPVEARKALDGKMEFPVQYERAAI